MIATLERTERDEKALTIIDDGLRLASGRSLISSDEVTDILLDLRRLLDGEDS